MLERDRLARRIEELGKAINTDYADKPLIMLGVLKGCVVFLADLIRHIRLPIELEFVTPAPARIGDRKPGDIDFAGDSVESFRGRHVLIVEGIVDTGRTAAAIRDKLRSMEPASVEIVTLLDKPSSHRTPVHIKYKGFSIGNDFVIGFGLDNAQKYRNLPYVGRVID
jgi:hypoxanthine phosphoribosyltransferase